MPPLLLLLLSGILLLQCSGDSRAARLQLPPQLLHLCSLPAHTQPTAHNVPWGTRHMAQSHPPAPALTWLPAG